MYALFEETGRFLAGRVLSETDTSAQVELDSGKRVKVKAAQLLLRFAQPGPADLLAQAQGLSATIELELAWEFSPDEEFGYADLARDYFSSSAGPVQQAAMLLRLFEAPHYFRRSGRGRFRKAPADIVAQALAAIERKKQVALQIADWAQQLGQGQCPAPVREQLYRILFRPDKNAPEYKAVVDAARATQLGPLALLQRAGAIDAPFQFHWRRFLLENFPRGTAFGAVEAPPPPEDLPLAGVAAFSIDDSATTEIDDALSVQGLGSGRVTVGIHIAAPALAVQPGSPVDRLGRERLSTVYTPGYKVTMLPDSVVQRYTLQEGRDCPAVSLYVTLDEATLEAVGHETRLERVPIQANLRHDQLDAVVTERWLQDPDFSQENEPQSLLGKRSLLSFLYRLAQHLKAAREQVRGKPETFSRPDYTFRLMGDANGEPQGDEPVQITTRSRGAPLDLIVAEAMILANSHWGGWMAELGVPAIYRSQASLLPGVKVRMGTKPLPHAGIGVRSYAWSTSPLRRYVDLVNQWQIIACARHGRTAALAAPFKARDTDLYAIVSAFDAAHAAYNACQATLERYWTLKFLEQQQTTELTATLIKDGLARCDTLPLVLPVAGAGGLPRGARLLLRLGAVDLITLDVAAALVSRLDTDDNVAAAPEPADEDEEATAGPIAIALDLSDHDAASPAGEPAPP